MRDGRITRPLASSERGKFPTNLKLGVTAAFVPTVMEHALPGPPLHATLWEFAPTSQQCSLLSPHPGRAGSASWAGNERGPATAPANRARRAGASRKLLRSDAPEAKRPGARAGGPGSPRSEDLPGAPRRQARRTRAPPARPNGARRARPANRPGRRLDWRGAPSSGSTHPSAPSAATSRRPCAQRLSPPRLRVPRSTVFWTTVWPASARGSPRRLPARRRCRARLRSPRQKRRPASGKTFRHLIAPKRLRWAQTRPATPASRVRRGRLRLHFGGGRGRSLRQQGFHRRSQKLVARSLPRRPDRQARRRRQDVRRADPAPRRAGPQAWRGVRGRARPDDDRRRLAWSEADGAAEHGLDVRSPFVKDLTARGEQPQARAGCSRRLREPEARLVEQPVLLAAVAAPAARHDVVPTVRPTPAPGNDVIDVLRLRVPAADQLALQRWHNGNEWHFSRRYISRRHNRFPHRLSAGLPGASTSGAHPLAKLKPKRRRGIPSHRNCRAHTTVHCGLSDAPLPARLNRKARCRYGTPGSALDRK